MNEIRATTHMKRSARKVGAWAFCREKLPVSEGGGAKKKKKKI